MAHRPCAAAVFEDFFGIMNIELLIAEIRSLLNTTFVAIDECFSMDERTRSYQPASGGWSINQVLEHVSLTNHFLLILIEKGAKKAIINVEKMNLVEALRAYSFHRAKLEEVGKHQSFQWIRPEHMEPKGEKSMAEIQQLLKNQLKQCLDTLDKLPNGEGALAKTTMTVNDLGKIDVYEYIFFLAQHVQRHLMQIEKIRLECES